MAPSKALEFPACRRGLALNLNVIFPGVINLISAKVETLRHDDCDSHSFSSYGHEFFLGGKGVWLFGSI